MAEDYLTDDEQLEHVKRVVVENWVWVAGGIALGAVLIFGYRYYDGYRDERAFRAAARFDDMASALEQHDAARSRQIAAGLIQDFPSSPYADQAQLVLARLFIDEGKLAQAVLPLTQVMNSSKDTELKHVARLRLARVLIDEGKPDEAIATLAADAPGAFAARYHEVRGDAFYAKKDFKSAVNEYTVALAGGEAGGVNAGLLQLKIADLSAPPGSPQPKADSPPKADSEPEANSGPKANSPPKADSPTKANSAPKADSPPMAAPQPKADSQPKAKP